MQTQGLRRVALVLLGVAGRQVSSSKLKVLCLHGYAQNGLVLRDRSGGFRKPLKKSRFEMHYPDGPFGCDTIAGEVDMAADEESMRRRAWYRRSPEDGLCPGWNESRETLCSLWEREGFDVLMGFSQGAAAAAMLCADLSPPLRPKIAIFVSGFVPRDAEVASSLHAGVDGVPSLHVMGLADVLVLRASKLVGTRICTRFWPALILAPPRSPAEFARWFDSCVSQQELVVPGRSHALASLFADATVVEHSGGHTMPSSADVRRQFVTFLERIDCLTMAGSGAGGAVL